MQNTLRDPRAWRDPDTFSPERFQSDDGGMFNFIPQGGGDANMGHRCPGEAIAIELMKLAADLLVNRISYKVPRQDLEINFGTLPAMVRSCFVITNVKIL